MSHKVLIEEDVEVIHVRLCRGDRGVDIARDFSVSQQTVSNIRTGKCWGHVTGLRPGDPRAHSNRGLLSREQVLEVDARLRASAEVSDLARHYGVSYQTIRAIRLGHSWAWLTGRPLCEPRKKDQ